MYYREHCGVARKSCFVTQYRHFFQGPTEIVTINVSHLTYVMPLTHILRFIERKAITGRLCLSHVRTVQSSYYLVCNRRFSFSFQMGKIVWLLPIVWLISVILTRGSSRFPKWLITFPTRLHHKGNSCFGASKRTLVTGGSAPPLWQCRPEHSGMD